MVERGVRNIGASAGASLALWRLASGIEVDFVVNDMEVAIEVKSARKVTSDHLKGLRHLRQDHPEVGRFVLVCLEEQACAATMASTCSRCGLP